jgi:hypothetical protein
MNRRHVRAAAVILLGCARITWSADLHVSPNGDDANPGTKEAPFASLRKARDAVRQRIASGLREDVVVHLRGGLYVLEEKLTFGPRDSGTGEHAILYRAASGETPVISGGRPITGWRKCGGGLWAADVPEVKAGRWHFRQLFVNGRRAPRAGAPDNGFFRVVKAGPDNRTSFTYRKGDLKRWPGIDRAEVLILTEWCVSRVRVKSVNEDSRVVALADPVGVGYRYNMIEGYTKRSQYRVENVRALLDAPGEWFLDRAAGRLLYRPRKGESLDRLKAFAPKLRQLVRIAGSRGQAVRNLRFERLTFAHTSRPDHPYGYGGTQACFYQKRSSTGDKRVGGAGIRMPGAVEVTCGVDCAFKACRFLHHGASGLDLGRGSHGNRVRGCLFDDIGANAVMVGMGREIWRRRQGGPWWKTEPGVVPRGNRIEDCLVTRPGQIFLGGLGIWVGNAKETLLSHNEITDTPYSGVSVGWVWSDKPAPAAGNIVEYNHIHGVMRKLSDGAGIYTLGRQPGTILRGNLIYDVPSPGGKRYGQGIYLDEGSAEILVEGNAVFGVIHAPFFFHRNGNRNIVRNNGIMMMAARTGPFRLVKTPRAHVELEGNKVVRGKRSPTLTVADGKKGRAFSCLGAGGHYDVPHTAAIDPPRLTLEAWFRASELSVPAGRPGGGWQEDRMWIVNKNGNELVDGHFALLLSRDRARAYLNIGGGEKGCRSVVSRKGSVRARRWHHLAMTYDGKCLRLYLDGTRAGEVSIGRPRRTGRSPLRIGGRQDGFDKVAFRGAIDEVRMYRRALSADEIKAHFASPGRIARDRAQVGHWGFDGGEENREPDWLKNVRRKAGPRTAPWAKDGSAGPDRTTPATRKRKELECGAE